MNAARSVRIADALLVLLAIAAIIYQFPRTLPGEHLLDYGSSLASGQAVKQGLNPYAIYPLTFRYEENGFETWNPNLSPPVAAWLYQGFAMVEPHLGFRIWYGITAVLYAATIFLLVRGFPRIPRLPLVVCAAALAGFWETLILGQIYVPLVFASVAAWLLLQRGSHIWAGILIGIVVAVKPNFFVWPALLLLSGRVLPALSSIGTAAILSAVPAVALGPQVYRQWFELIASDGARAIFPTNAAFSGFAARVDAPLLGTVAGLLLLVGVAGWALLRSPSIRRVSAVALLTSLLASPLAWIHYTLFLLPVICWTWERRATRVFVACAIVPAPFVVDHLWSPKWLQLTIGSLYNWALLLLLTLLAASELRRVRAAALLRIRSKSEPASTSPRKPAAAEVWTEDAS